MRDFLRDIARGFRALRRQPGFTVATVLTLALGIGATTAIFAVLNRIVLRPLPYATADRLVDIGTLWPKIGPDTRFHISPANYFFFRAHSRTLEDIAAYLPAEANVTGDGAAEQVREVLASAGIFHVLGIRPYLGRLFTAADDQPSDASPRATPAPGAAAPVLVLSYDFWKRRLGGDPGAVGRTLEVDGRPLPVVGVLPPGTQLPDRQVDVWRPLGLNPNANPTNWHTFNALAVLRPGFSLADAQRELDGFRRHFEELMPSAYPAGWMAETGFHMDVRDARELLVGGVERTLWLLLAAVALVLLIACANVANLFAVRAEARSRESAVRAALGADRRRLAGHFLGETLVLAVLGATLGLALADAALGLLVRIAPPSLPRVAEIGLGWEAVAFAGALALLAALAFAAVPLLRATHPEAALHGGRGITAGRRRHVLRGALVVSQMALAVVLLAAAGLMARSAWRLRHVDAGIQPRGVLALYVSLPFRRYADYPQVAAFYRELAGRIRSLPGVSAAGFGENLPLGGYDGCNGLAPEQPAAIRGDACVGASLVSPGFLQALGIRVRGRIPDWSDLASGSGAVVVSRQLAQHFWGGADPIGRGIKGNGSRPPFYRIVGVTEGVRYAGLDRPPAEMAYFPLEPVEGAPLWIPPRSTWLVVRSTVPPAALTAAIRRVIGELDPGVALGDVETMDQVMDASMAVVSMTMLLLTVAALMALVLSAIGLYGVVAYIVGERTSEIGVRMAVGAPAGQVAREVVRRSARLALVGAAAGVLGALAVTRLLRSLLFEVSPGDPVTLFAVAVLLVGVALLASYLPARRAAALEPMTTLRVE